MKRVRGLFSLLILCMMIIVSSTGCQRAEQTSKDTSEPTQSHDSTIGGKTQGSDNGQTQNEEKKDSYLVPVGKNNGFTLLYGYTDSKGNMVIEPKFKTAEPFYSFGVALVTDTNDKFGLIDKTGKYVIEPVYDWMNYTDGLFITYDGNKDITLAFDDKGNKIFEIKGYIYNYNEGLSTYYTETQKGYIDKTGKLVLNLNYSSLGDFVDGLAIVSEIYEGPSFYIDKNGNDQTDKVSSGLRIFQDQDTKLFGYVDDNENIIIGAKFAEATPFLNGFAIVSQTLATDNQAMYGIIDTNGNFVVEPKYCGIKRMRNGTFAVGGEAKAGEYLPYEYFEYTPKALYTPDLKDHTDWVYFSVENLDKDTVCVNDEKSVAFLDSSLKPAKNLPSFKGQGSFTLDGEYMRGSLNFQDVVADRDGNLLVVCDGRIDLGDGVESITKIETPLRTYKMAFPVISGIKDESIQNKINSEIYDEMVSPYKKDTYEDPVFIDTFESGYSISKQKKLILIDQGIYMYSLGAAHGGHFRNTVYIDSETGAVYTLSDLFKPGDEVYTKLSEMVTAKMQETMEEVGYFEDHATIDSSRPFVLTDKGIILYFGEYEIASYAAGSPEFFIPFSDLDSYINKDGDFWKSFN